jgi:ketosteroid isomerase-like protein
MLVMSGPPPVSALAVACGYHDAWQRRDYQAAWQLLSDDLTVEVPVNSYDSKAAFAEAAQRTREMTAAVTPLAEFGNDGEAVLIYDLTLPIGDLRIAEYFHVRDGRITQITHIHDTAALRAAAAGP